MLPMTKKKYLFTIYELGYHGENIRSVDIAKALGVKKASVSNMLPSLIEQNMITKDKNGIIALTPDGAKYAGGLYLKYLTFFEFFSGKLKSSDENARKDAIICLSLLSDENTDALTDYILNNSNAGAIYRDCVDKEK